jgi:branched-chain amino acid transport system permease protein
MSVRTGATWGRPRLFTSYETEASIFPTWTQRIAAAALLLVLVLMPFDLPVISQIPFIRFLGDDVWLRIVNSVLIFAVAAVGLNLLLGVGGQVSLGHAFFMGVGAYAAVVLGAEGGGTLWGLGLPIWVWLPGAGVAAALAGIIVAPTAVRVRGLYLAIVTLGLVFLGQHLGRMFDEIAGPAGLGRRWPNFDIRIWKEEDPFIDMSSAGRWLWFDVTKNMKTYFFLLLIVVVMTVVAKNLVRTRTGRALQAIRDRDVAAEIMGVPEARYKLIAFSISSFYAGVAGALLASFAVQSAPENWNLFLSVEIIAIVLIGGAGTTAGALLGTVFVVLGPHFVEQFTRWLAERGGTGGPVGLIADVVLTTGARGDGGAIATGTTSPGWALSVFDWNQVLYGVLIVVFLIFEPLGLYGLWVRVRNYWKGWPFTY